jgi:hypothetical protein
MNRLIVIVLAGERCFDSRRRVNFYEAGSGQEIIRVDWFTLLFKVTRVSHRGGAMLFVASVNGATKLILRREVYPQVDARAFRHLNHSEPSLRHLTITSHRYHR